MNIINIYARDLKVYVYILMTFGHISGRSFRYGYTKFTYSGLTNSKHSEWYKKILKQIIQYCQWSATSRSRNIQPGVMLTDSFIFHLSAERHEEKQIWMGAEPEDPQTCHLIFEWKLLIYVLWRWWTHNSHSPSLISSGKRVYLYII